MNKDLQHLKILSIFHYILGGLIAAGSSVFIFHFAVGVTMILSPASMGAAPSPPPIMGWLFAFLGGAAVLFGWGIGIGLIVAGRFLNRRRHHLFCMVTAGIVAALFHPLGTALGVFTIIVLLRPSVKRLFETGELPYDPEEDETPARAADDRIASGSYNIYSER
jgi:hypothetical protein